MKVQVDVKKYEDAQGSYAVRATLTDAKGNKVKELTSDRFTMNGKGKKTVELSSLITNPDKWTCETPVLYGLKLELLNESGAVMQEIASKHPHAASRIRSCHERGDHPQGHGDSETA